MGTKKLAGSLNWKWELILTMLFYSRSALSLSLFLSSNFLFCIYSPPIKTLIFMKYNSYKVDIELLADPEPGRVVTERQHPIRPFCPHLFGSHVKFSQIQAGIQINSSRKKFFSLSGRRIVVSTKVGMKKRKKFTLKRVFILFHMHKRERGQFCKVIIMVYGS